MSIRAPGESSATCDDRPQVTLELQRNQSIMMLLAEQVVSRVDLGLEQQFEVASRAHKQLQTPTRSMALMTAQQFELLVETIERSSKGSDDIHDGDGFSSFVRRLADESVSSMARQEIHDRDGGASKWGSRGVLEDRMRALQTVHEIDSIAEFP